MTDWIRALIDDDGSVAARGALAQLEELEAKAARADGTPFALDWRDELAGIAEDLGLPVGTSLAADVRRAVRARLKADQPAATETAPRCPAPQGAPEPLDENWLSTRRPARGKGAKP